MRIRWILTALTWLIFLSVREATASKILFIGAVCTKGEKGFFSAVAKALADNGHHVTLVSPFKPSKVHPNIREIVLEGLDITKNLPDLFNSSPVSGPRALVDQFPKACSDALSRKEVQALMEEDFDLGLMSIVINNCFLSMFHHLKIPFIYVCPLFLVGPASTMVGNPEFSSFVNTPFLHITHPFTFPERMLNVVCDALLINLFTNYLITNIENECRRRGLCPDSVPSIREMSYNASLQFVNSVKTVEEPVRPYVPSIVHIGGVHCHDPKPLSQDLEEWIAGAGEDGFIFFSLGSVVKPSSMPEEYRKILVTAFGSLKQRVLWKWDQKEMDDLPPNVRIGKWFPQQDILGHQRLRLFISHGGALSMQESMYHGIPVLGLPVFGDQIINMAKAQEQGWAGSLNWKELSTQLLKDQIMFGINDEKIRTEVKRRSVLMHDLPLTPAEEVNYWVEYVIRHKGAPHLRSPILSMAWYQVYNVDVWLTILGVVLLVLYVTLKLLLIICRCMCTSKSKSKKD